MRHLRFSSLATVLVLSATPGLLVASSDPASPSPEDRPAAAAAPAASLGAFGAAIVVHGDEIFVGGPGAVSLFPVPGNRRGEVHVFARTGGGLELTSSVSAEDGELGDGFGAAIAVDGDLLVVGAPQRDAGKGVAYVFERVAGSWRQAARITAPSPFNADEFGSAVAVSGNRVMVGAPGRDEGQGAVFLYARRSGSWSVVQTIEAPGDGVAGRFGSALGMDGDRAVVGAPGTWMALLPTLPAAPKPGAIYFYSETGGAWSEDGAQRSSSTSPELLGWAVSLSGNDAWASAPFGNAGKGEIRGFRRTGDGTWAATATVTRVDGPGNVGFGYAFARAGDHMFVGAPMAQTVTAFRESGGGTWTEGDTYTNTEPFSFFGSAVGGGGDIAVIGIPGADLFEGSGDVYAFEAGAWTETGTLLVEAGGLDAITGAEVRCDESGDIAGFTCADVDLVSFLPTDAIGGERGSFTNDVWGWTDSATGVEYAIVGRNDATTFISLADPTAPVYLGELPLTKGAVPNLWRDMKVYADHAFIVSDGAGEHGMQVFDLTRLRNVVGAPVIFEEDAHYDGIFSAHNIVINEETGFAYIVGSSMGGTTCGGGLHMVDIRDPLSPTFAGCYSDPTTGMAGTGFTHDAQCLTYRGPDADHRGREICLGANETALSIVDVTDKANPVSLATIGYPNSAYVHQGWISEDHQYFFTNDEGDELAGVAAKTRTLVWDIADLDDPVLATEHFGTTESSDHNLYIRGQLMYQSNYVSGLRVLDVSDPTNPVEVGYFDTVPWGADAPGFAGSWSNYPFFESGVIVVSSMREGVFFLKKRPRTIS